MTQPIKILVTGATGFVGQTLCRQLSDYGIQIRACVRNKIAARQTLPTIELLEVGNIGPHTSWESALAGVDVVIHLAARVHVMQGDSKDSLESFRNVNVEGTANLAQQAAAAGVKRFVFLSSVKVNGEATYSKPFSSNSKEEPIGAYGISKWEAEQALLQISAKSGIEVVIIRPPLVYGPGVKANFLKLLNLINRGIPLPLGRVQNVRSLIYVENLVDALYLCATHPAAVGQVYLVSDNEDVSSPELIRKLAIHMGKKPYLVNIPPWMLRIAGLLVGRAKEIDRLLTSLQVDSSAICKQLGWAPKFKLEQGLQETISWYNKQNDDSNILFSANGHGKMICNHSVVIVNYNAGNYLLECVSRARQQAEQVIVVDNASTDDSIRNLTKVYPDVITICNEHNLGFAVACNMGARAADGKYILFLNPDCFLEPNAIATLVKSIESAPNIGMVGGLIINPDGTEQIGGRRAIPTPWRSFVRGFGLSRLRKLSPRFFSDFSLHGEPMPEQPIEVEAISGACMLSRRDILEEIGLLDEGYFMHCEDLDWCMRFHLQNLKILFVPKARMVHHKGHCSQSRPVFVEWNKHKGMMRFYRKFFKKQYSPFLMLVIWAGIWVRFGLIAFLLTTKNVGHKVRSVFG